jgi:hypothetical protein
MSSCQLTAVSDQLSEKNRTWPVILLGWHHHPAVRTYPKKWVALQNLTLPGRGGEIYTVFGDLNASPKTQKIP